MKFSIIMPVFMQRIYQFNMTVACLNNIHAFTYDYEIVFLHSYAEYGSDIKNYLRDQDQYIPFKENVSQPVAINRGITESKGDYVILIGNDNLVHQNWLSEIDKKLDDPYCQILACSVDRVPYSEWEATKAKYEPSNGIKYHAFSYLNFQGLTIKKNIFNDIGLLDENLPFYFWERDIDKRLEDKNYHCGAVITSLMTTPQSLTRWEGTTPQGVTNWWSEESNIKEIDYYQKKWGYHP
jgi:glycosyltransferase involved in cell wall biosynthesis